MTAIDISIANRSGISLKNAKKIDSVHGLGGTVGGHLVTVKEFWLGGAIKDGINKGGFNIGITALLVLPFNANSEVLAVLGMNVIKEFKTTIDLQRKTKHTDGTILMEPTFDASDMTPADSFIPEQSRFGVWSNILS